MTKDVIDAIKERRTVRKFKKQPIPEATIGRLIEAARCAPSAGSVQPWQFTVVLNPGVIQELAQTAEGQSFVGEAPACIIVSAEPERSASRFGDRGEDLYCIQDTAAATQNILLAATGYGLGTCWVGGFDESGVRRLAGIPDQLRPMAIVPVGYPDEEGEETATRSQDEVVRIIR